MDYVKSVNKMNSILIKSDIGNRARLKSDIFKKYSHITRIKNEFSELIFEFRENISCKSIIFKYSNEITLAQIVEKIQSLFSHQDYILI